MSDRHTELHHLLNRAIDGVVLHGESDRLRELVRDLEADMTRVQERACRAAEKLRKAEAQRDRDRAAITSVRELHERRDNGAGPYCYLCADSGDMDWPCATIRALDEQQLTTCNHCAHPTDWHDPWEGCVGPDGIGSARSGDCTCTRNSDQTQLPPAE